MSLALIKITKSPYPKKIRRNRLYCLALIATVFSLIMYVKDLYQKGFIDKQDLKKEVTIDKKEKKKSSSK